MDILIKFSEEELQRAREAIDNTPFSKVLTLREHVNEVARRGHNHMGFIAEMKIGDSGYITDWFIKKDANGEHTIPILLMFGFAAGGTLTVPIKRVKSGFVIQWIDSDQ